MTDNLHYWIFTITAFLLMAFACSGFVPNYRQWEYASAVYVGFVLLAVLLMVFNKDRRKRKLPR